ncbi:hypothetical protein BC827DRAFT_1264387 [Russula dissimulans]|nr:hypothetical protein BC827DRAFT_1264387 [Russula dissimulans]
MATKSTPNKHQSMPSSLPTSFPFSQPLKGAFLSSLPIHLLAPARHVLLTLAFAFILTLGVLPSKPELLTLIKLCEAHWVAQDNADAVMEDKHTKYKWVAV